MIYLNILVATGTTSTADSGRPETVTFGRTLVDGTPMDDGLTFPSDSPPLDVLADATAPLISNPQLGEYAAALTMADDTDGEYSRGLIITPPGAQGPAEHFHPNYDEHFEVVEGEFIVEINGEPQTVHAGEKLTVEAGLVHTFRNEPHSYASVIGEALPARVNAAPAWSRRVSSTDVGRDRVLHLCVSHRNSDVNKR